MYSIGGCCCRARNVIKMMHAEGIAVSAVPYTMVAVALCMQGSMAAATQVMQEMQAAGLQVTKHIYTCLMSVQCKSGNLAGAQVASQLHSHLHHSIMHHHRLWACSVRLVDVSLCQHAPGYRTSCAGRDVSICGFRAACFHAHVRFHDLSVLCVQFAVRELTLPSHLMLGCFLS